MMNTISAMATISSTRLNAWRLIAGRRRLRDRIMASPPRAAVEHLDGVLQRHHARHREEGVVLQRRLDLHPHLRRADLGRLEDAVEEPVDPPPGARLVDPVADV